MHQMELTTVDAFTDRRFGGNPAAVALVDSFPPDDLMQKIAREMNLSETSFVAPRGGEAHDLRWFTPSTEVDLCGHATLAAAHVVGGRPTFHTRSGPLRCEVGGDGLVEMDFPLDVPVRSEELPHLALETISWFGVGTRAALAVVDDARTVRGYVPDQSLISSVDSNLVVLSAFGDKVGVDFVSRVFAPKLGIPEDPVTGSAHCTLAAFWAERLDKSELLAMQVSERGGTVQMRIRGDRVMLGGRAVTVSKVLMSL
jgi:predicted PhzF superfamily epimerase YddE/YHI9